MPKSRSRKKKQNTAPVTAQTAPKSEAPNPDWWVPVMVTLFLVGLVYIVVTYLSGPQYPVPGIGNWNLGVGFALIMAGFIMTMRWR